jgi:hypothetical protein
MAYQYRYHRPCTLAWNGLPRTLVPQLYYCLGRGLALLDLFVLLALLNVPAAIRTIKKRTNIWAPGKGMDKPPSNPGDPAAPNPPRDDSRAPLPQTLRSAVATGDEGITGVHHAPIPLSTGVPKYGRLHPDLHLAVSLASPLAQDGKILSDHSQDRRSTKISTAV